MALEQRKNGKLYYYRSRRVDGRVEREYVGCGDTARLAAERDAHARAELAAQRQAIDQYHAHISSVRQPIEQLHGYLRSVIAAVLLDAGFHQHDRGNWHRRVA